MDRAHLATFIAKRLNEERDRAAEQYAQKHHFVVDDLLPIDLAEKLYRNFPNVHEMMLRNSIRERKYVTSQMDHCQPVIEDAVYAFQDPRVVEAIANITRLRALEPDARLYAGGVSLMAQGHYLHPHIDNSHDMERARYRVLNLLYYTTPGWAECDGGNLELWPDGRTGKPLTIHSRFNRLLVIATNRSSWHSVSPLSGKAWPHLNRTCVSNYYFSPVSPEGEDYFHVTSFRGRPEQPVLNVVLRAEAALRMLVRKAFPRGAVKTKHYYQRGDSSKNPESNP